MVVTPQLVIMQDDSVILARILELYELITIDPDIKYAYFIILMQFCSINH